MPFPRWIIGATLLLFFSGCFQATHDVGASVFGGATAMEEALSGDRVTIRKATLRSLEHGNARRLSDYRLGYEIELTPRQTDLLKNLLRDSHSYGWGYLPECNAPFDVLITLHSAQNAYLFALDFECGRFWMYKGGARVSQPDDLSPMRSQLTALVREIFSADRELRNLR